MNTSSTWLVTLLALPIALALSACDPSTKCDPGWHAMKGGCYKNTRGGSSKDAGNDDDAGAANGGKAGASGGSCSGAAYDGFGTTCTMDAECGCHAAKCATAPLNYCTKINCDAKDSAACPPKWTCIMIPAGASPDPSIKTICLKP
ncbi:MAG TPA: hypothetical protein VHM19_00270 [Polyangiales bacterium]|jgi:hypothetical protein|nr:hypothetical protein [Polyangiales bacterium]